MHYFIEYKEEFVALVIRIILGVLLINQGYDKLFRIGVERSSMAASDALHSLHLAKGLVKLITVVTSLIEFAGGVLLLLGFMTVPACYIILSGLLPVTIAMSTREPLWNMQLVWSRLVMVVFLLLTPAEWQLVSIDHLLK